MKKVLDFIKKYWKGFLAILGIGIAAKLLIDSIPEPYKKDIDVNKENKKIDQTTIDTKKQIDINTEKQIEDLNNKTPDEVENGLSTITNKKIDKIKSDAVDNIVNDVLGGLG